jgi:hypothetical protein
MLRLLPIYINNTDRSTTVDWWGTDSKQEYDSNILRLGTSWEYYNKKVTYTVNSQGYRCKEFDAIDWENSYVILGCSHVFGEGNSYEDTISTQVRTITNTNCINLGVCASSSEHCFLNALKLFSNTSSKKVIIIWPYKTRENFYDNKSFYMYKNILNKGGLTQTNKNLLHKWLRQVVAPIVHWEYLRETYIETLSALYGDRFISITIEELEMEFGGATNEQLSYDLARDRNHYGPKWNAKVANKILKEIHKNS